MAPIVAASATESVPTEIAPVETPPTFYYVSDQVSFVPSESHHETSISDPSANIRPKTRGETTKLTLTVNC